MSIHLYKHNEDAYRAVETMLEEKQMAAVIHPTGTGKSMIAFKLVEQHPHKHFLWLSPSEYIYKTQLENIDTQFSNIEYMSYSRLMKHEDSIDTLHPDYIILDEFHRCGAAEWGKSVRKLLEAYPKAKRLGLSATNIRYLDNQRNMAEELFEGNIASEMTLGEAIVREILPEPKYVIAMYSYKKELEQLKKRIEGLSNPGLVSENEKLLEQLKRALEQADGLTEVFARQMTKPDGKYIVFCSGREHMDEMKAQAGDWFSKVDKKPHIYTAYYNEASTSKAFAEFKKDTGSHLKLLYCIDMLNEGIHVDDVDGVILLRPTVSPIIYLQQIGRALSAGNKNQPVIFDLVNNFDSLCTINVLTGFKFIGEQIGKLEQQGKVDSYVFGFEESYGYLTGSYVRDKDGVDGAYMICEMFSYYAAKGISLLDKLDELYKTYGYCLNTLHSYEFDGSAGFAKMQSIMQVFRGDIKEFGGKKVVKLLDYAPGLDGLPKSDVLKFLLEDNCSIVVRPSGTEPKLKTYISVSAENKEAAEKIEAEICESAEEYLK